MGVYLDALFDEVRVLIEGGNGSSILLGPPSPHIVWDPKLKPQAMKDALENNKGHYIYQYYLTLDGDRQWALIRELTEEHIATPAPDINMTMLINPSLGAAIDDHVRRILRAEWEKRPKPVLP